MRNASSRLVFIWLAVSVVVSYSVSAASFPAAKIDWAPDNPMFSDASHSQPVERAMNEQLHLICQEGVHADVYMVDAVSAKECSTAGASAKHVGTCKGVRGQLRITIRSVAAISSVPVFSPGHDYYFISTSSGFADGRSDRHGGMCAEGVRLTVRVIAARPPSAIPPSTSTRVTTTTTTRGYRMGGPVGRISGLGGRQDEYHKYDVVDSVAVAAPASAAHYSRTAEREERESPARDGFVHFKMTREEVELVKERRRVIGGDDYYDEFFSGGVRAGKVAALSCLLVLALAWWL